MFILQLIIVGIILTINFFFVLMLFGAIFGHVFGAPFVPTGTKIARKMIKMAQIKKKDKVFDLGCGDGRLVFEAEKYSKHCVGIEVSPPVYLLALIRRFFLHKKSKIYLGNFFKHSEIKDADVIFLFLFPKIIDEFHKQFYPHLKKGTRIVSHAFRMKGEKAKKEFSRQELGHAPLYLYVKK